MSYADALHDIHCTGDAVRRMKYWGRDSAGEPMLWDKSDTAWKYVIPVHLVAKELFDGCSSLLERQHCVDTTDRDNGLCDFLWYID